MEIHHILEKRFHKTLPNKNTNTYLRIALPHDEHVKFTNKWRKNIQYSTHDHTKFQLFEAASDVYKGHPDLMGVVIETLFIN